MSKGGRRISASPATKNTTSAGSCHSSHHGRQAATMPGRERVPAAIATDAAASTTGSSYPSSCAAARGPPSSEYLLALDHAAMRTATTPTPTTARTANSPTSNGCPTSRSAGPSGMNSNATRYGSNATIGATRNTGRSAASGVRSSFWTNLTPSAMSWAQPWKAPAYIGPSRPCMCAITLCSVCPTSSGRVRNATMTASTRRTTSSIGGAPLARGRDAGRAHRVAPGRVGVGLARLLGAGPRLGDAGGQDELLAQGVPLELGRQEQRSQAGMAGEVDAEHLVRLPLVPGGAGIDVHNGRQDRRLPRYRRPEQQAALCRHRPDVGDHREAGVQLVHRRQPVEEVVPVLARPGHRRGPVVRRHVDGHPGEV